MNASLTSQVEVSNGTGFSLQRVLESVRQVNRNPNLSQPIQLGEGWEKVALAMEGWLHGIMLVAGQTNHGKSSVVINLVRELAVANDEHLFVMDFTLDDTLRRRISVYAASLVNVQINDVLMEHRVQDPRILSRIDSAYNALSTWEDVYRVYDTAEIGSQLGRVMITASVESISSIVEQQIEAMRRQNDARKVLVVIDAINDLTSNRPFESDLQRQEYIVQQLVTLATTYDVRILCTSHSRKSTNWKNPNLDDVFGGSALKYAAQIITFVYNDITGKTNPDQSPMLIQDDLPEYYQGLQHIRRHAPVLVWYWRKNKTSPFVGKFFLKLTQWSNRVEVLPDALSDVYDRKFSEII